MKLKIITSNAGKAVEFRTALGSLGIEVEPQDEDCDEIQADTLEEVRRSCSSQLRSKGLGDYVLDDSGLFINALGGFPAYSAYALRTIGIDGILRLMDGRADRSARFRMLYRMFLQGERSSSSKDVAMASSPNGRRARGLRLRPDIRSIWI